MARVLKHPLDLEASSLNEDNIRPNRGIRLNLFGGSLLGGIGCYDVLFSLGGGLVGFDVYHQGVPFQLPSSTIMEVDHRPSEDDGSLSIPSNRKRATQQKGGVLIIPWLQDK